MKNIELIIFDLDGTLIDSKLDLANAVNHSLQTLGLPGIENEKVYGFIGDGLWKLIERSLGAGNADKLENAVRLFREYYGRHLLDNTKLYPGVENTLARFKGKKKAVVTNKPEGFSRDILEGLKILEHFNLVYGGDTFNRHKPDPHCLLCAMRELGAEVSRVVMVGDGRNDILAAKAASIASCAVGYGLENKQQLMSAGPDFYIENISQLAGIIE